MTDYLFRAQIRAMTEGVRQGFVFPVRVRILQVQSLKMRAVYAAESAPLLLYLKESQRLIAILFQRVKELFISVRTAHISLSGRWSEILA
ncbi:hypothetical protein [Cupriavidus basilensis]|uniref:hypothetical protein n=1 Tax=Cupriavidus basilensis TaxID=68895 RepID=UPI0005BA8555|nr:hypothetical protein [Cupriavidus basilensis]